MDYARNNPWHTRRLRKRRWLTPPILGVYDIFTLSTGDIVSQFDAKHRKTKSLHWISGSKRKRTIPCTLSEHNSSSSYDPTDQTEDLGNDHFRAGEMAVSNLKIIMKISKMAVRRVGKDFTTIQEQYAAIVQQYNRHLRHTSLPYIGGVLFKEVRQGENELLPTLIWTSYAEKSHAVDFEPSTYLSRLVDAGRLHATNQCTHQLCQFGSPLYSGLPCHPTVLFRIQEGGIIDPAKITR